MHIIHHSATVQHNQPTAAVLACSRCAGAQAAPLKHAAKHSSLLALVHLPCSLQCHRLLCSLYAVWVSRPQGRQVCLCRCVIVPPGVGAAAAQQRLWVAWLQLQRLVAEGDSGAKLRWVA